MSSLNPEATLPPGFRFHPTDEELIVHYLRRRASNQPLPVAIIAEVDIYKHDPWHLPEKALFGDREWYFFTPRDRKYPNGIRPNRAAGSGYWKATGTDRPITSPSPNGGTAVEIGVKKALVFYIGKPPKGTKTSWIMHEYRLAGQPAHHRGLLHFVHGRANGNKNQMTNLDPAADTSASSNSMRLDDWVLCRIYKKNTNTSGNSHGGAATSVDGTSDDCHNEVDDSNNNNNNNNNNNHNVVADGAYYAASTYMPSSLPGLPLQGTTGGDGMLPRPASLSDFLADVTDYAALTRLLQDQNPQGQQLNPGPVLLGRPIDAEPSDPRNQAASSSTTASSNKRQRLLEGAYAAGFYNHVDNFGGTVGHSMALPYRNSDPSLNSGMMTSFQISSYGDREGVDQQMNNSCDLPQHGTASPLNHTSHLGFR